MMNNNNNIIKIEARLNRILFPKAPLVLGKGSNTFGIVSWTPMLELEGTVKINDWDSSIIVKGIYEDTINPSVDYTIVAKEVYDEKRGTQYELIFIGKLMKLTSINSQKTFLKTFLTDSQVSEMFKTLEDPLKIIDQHDIESLKKVHGIGNYIANCIIERYEKNKDNCEAYIELDSYGLTPKFIQKLITRYKNPHKVIEIVKNNPYQLSFDVEGIGFKTADKIALSSGISPKSPQRIKGYINYLLEDLAQSGNSYITSGELTAYIFEEFNGKDNILEMYFNDNHEPCGNNISQAIDELQEENVLVVEDAENRSMRRVYLKKYWKLEKDIAYHLKRISDSPNEFEYSDWEKIIELQENKQGWRFTEEQKNGIKLGLDKQVCFITGGAGTGKSSLVSGILESLKKYSFAQTALAGKASARLQEVTGAEGFTIHRLLGFLPGQGFLYNEDNPLDYNIIILDEISLVGGEIFLSLIKAIPNGTKLIILGDMGQLESIGCMNLASDLYHSDFITTVELTKIHRQAQKSGIILASQQMRSGTPVLSKNFVGKVTMGELQDMHFDITDSTDTVKNKIMEWFKLKYESNLVKDIMDIQILVPCKERGDASVFNLNLDVQAYVNPPSCDKNEITVNTSNGKNYVLREGDKVMCIKNNYNIPGEKRTGVYNGWCGILKKIDEYFDMYEVYIPMIDDTMIFNKSDLVSGVILGYASTVHKYQGSSAKVIIGGIDNSTPPNMRTKELLYTLWTRAEKECVTVAQNTALYNSTFKSGVSNKNTFLIELLKETQ